MTVEKHLKVGHTVVLADTLAPGDLCYFEEPKDGRVYVRKLHAGEVAAFQGEIYRFEFEPKAGIARIRLAKREELER